MKAGAVYCRRSKIGGKSIAFQEQDGRRTLAARGFEVGAVFKEEVSASRYAKKSRKEWDRLRVAVKRGEFGAVAVWLEDRVDRTVLEAYDFAQDCKQAGVFLIISDSDKQYDFQNTDDENQFLGAALDAKKEVDRLRRRTLRGKRHSAERGNVNGGGTRPFGYQRGGRAIHPFEAELIREAVRRVIAGDSLRGIALDWQARGVTTPTGSVWANPTLRRMLMSPRIAGLREHNGMLYPAAWDAIVGEDDWRQVVAILGDPARAVSKGGTPRHLLSGLAKCGACGKGMYGKYRKRPERLRHYACRSDKPRSGCGNIQRLADPVEEEVLNRLFFRVESPAWDEQAAERPEEDPTRELYEQNARDQARLDKLEDEQVLAKLDEDGVKEQAIRRVRAEIEARMERARSEINQLRGNQVAAQIPQNLREVWDDFSLDRQRAILAAVIEIIVILPQGPGARFDPDTVKVLYRDRKLDPPWLTALPWWRNGKNGPSAST